MKQNKIIETRRTRCCLAILSILLLLTILFASCGENETTTSVTTTKKPTGSDTEPNTVVNGTQDSPQDGGHVHAFGQWETVKAATYTEQGEEKRTCSCGEVEKRFVSVKTHDYKTVVTPPTCTEKGFTTYTCSCGDSHIADYVDAKGHDYKSLVTKPTCTEKGFTTYTCSCGDAYTDNYVNASGHTYGEWVNVSGNACTEKSEEKRACQCGEAETRTVSAKGHDYKSTLTKPTCTEKGYTTYTCHCGDTYVSNYTNATGHSYGAWETVKEPSDSEAGEEKRTCHCGDVEIHVTPATGHDYKADVTAPTCSEKGYTTYTCECGDTYVSDYVNASGHSYTTKVIAPTCSEKGYTIYTCHCGDTYKDDYVNANGHSYGAWETVTAATCTKSGEEKHTCHCGDFETRTIAAKGHDYKTTVKKPTCSEKGYTTYTCQCGDSYVSDYVNATGHSYTAKVTAPTCTVKGYTTYTCLCGDSYVDDYVNAKGHSYTSVEENGYIVYKCSCGHTYSEDIPQPQWGTRIRVNYVVNIPNAGSIIGKSTQDVYYGRTSTEAISVTANLGYKFVGWSDGSLSSARSGDCPKRDATYTAIFEFDAKELPILDLYTDSGLDITSKEVYVPGTISIHNAPEGYNFEDVTMEIRGRGNYTWKSGAKKPYRIKLTEKMNLLGLGNGKARSWVLLANHCDQSLLRNQTVYQFAEKLSGIVWQPSTQSVEVFLNGNYIGVYVLTEQVQIHKKRINLSEDITGEQVDFLVHRSGYAYNDGQIAFTYDGEPYEIVSDIAEDNAALYQKQYNYISGRIAECWDAVKGGNRNEVEALIDVSSVIDTLIAHELFKNLDTGHDNFYMFASVDSKLFFGPVWDFDQCAGNANLGVETYVGLRGSETNKWYQNFLKLDWFKELFLARWDELFDNEIQSVPAMIRDAAQAGYYAYCRNFDKWQILGYTDASGNKQMGQKINREPDDIRYFQSFEEHYEYFATWMENRIVWLNQYYHSNDFIKQDVKLNLSGKGTQASPYLINTAEDFYNFTLVMANGDSFEGKYFRQTANIDMTKISYYSGVANPGVFAGVYDGAGHTINAKIISTEGSFFPYVTGTIMNLVTTGSITNSGHTGGICRSVRVNGLILNCGSTATLSSSGGNVGGIAPSNQEGGGSVIGCWFAGKIVGANNFSPIVVYVSGRTHGTIQNNFYVSDFYDFNNTNEPAIKSENETAIARSDLTTLYAKLNQNLATTATLAGVSKDQLCSWKLENGVPVLIPKS